MNTSNTRGFTISLLRWLLVFVLAPNLVFFIVGRFFFLDRALVNLDYAAVGVFWTWLPVWLRVTTFAIAFIVDGITSTGSMYNISPVAGVVALFRAPIGLLITVILAFAGVCALAAALGAAANRFLTSTPRNVLFATSSFALAVLLALFVPTRSASARLAGDILERDRGYRTAPARVEAATDALRRDAERQEDNVALIVVESWGLLADSAAHTRLLDVFRTPALQQRYETRSGAVRFRGGTTSGELRELCGVLTDYLVLNDQIIAGCLPTELRRRGFRAVAMHGYKPAYYSRDRWYPRLFDRILFEDSLATGDKRCGTQFRGICDLDVFRTFEREVRAGNRQFTYWLSIDAHTPVDVDRMPEMDLAGCQGPADFCLVVAFWRELFQAIAQLAADPALPRTRFIIVGDHAPAFVLQSRARGLRKGVVPFVELLPRGNPKNRPNEPTQ